MAVTDEMVAIALKTKPHAVCIVPEKRAERTTEGGLDVAGEIAPLRLAVDRLRDAGIRVSLFINADDMQVSAAKEVGADVVEFHTGKYCEAEGEWREVELKQIIAAAAQAHALGLESHAGHGLSYDTVGPIAAIPQIVELNIGHFLIGEAIYVGLKETVREMRRLMDAARV